MRNFGKKEVSLMTETMHNGIYEGVHVSQVPVDYLMFVIKCSKENSCNPNTLLAKDFLKLKGYDEFRKKAIEYKAKMIMQEYEYEKKCLENNSFYFYLQGEVQYKTHTKNGRINKNAIENITAYSIDDDFDKSVGLVKQGKTIYVDMIKRFITYALKTRAITLNVMVSRNILSNLYGGDDYALVELNHDTICEELSTEKYEKMIIMFYMRYRDQIENGTEFMGE